MKSITYTFITPIPSKKNSKQIFKNKSGKMFISSSSNYKDWQRIELTLIKSKRRLAVRIVDKILEDNPNTHYVYDLFGGGGAISFEFLQRQQIKKVFYNELNTGVVELLRKIVKNGVTDEEESELSTICRQQIYYRTKIHR